METRLACLALLFDTIGSVVGKGTLETETCMSILSLPTMYCSGTPCPRQLPHGHVVGRGNPRRDSELSSFPSGCSGPPSLLLAISSYGQRHVHTSASAISLSLIMQRLPSYCSTSFHRAKHGRGLMRRCSRLFRGRGGGGSFMSIPRKCTSCQVKQTGYFTFWADGPRQGSIWSCLGLAHGLVWLPMQASISSKQTTTLASSPAQPRLRSKQLASPVPHATLRPIVRA